MFHWKELITLWLRYTSFLVTELFLCYFEIKSQPGASWLCLSGFLANEYWIPHSWILMPTTCLPTPSTIASCLRTHRFHIPPLCNICFTPWTFPIVGPYSFGLTCTFMSLSSCPLNHPLQILLSSVTPALCSTEFSTQRACGCVCVCACSCIYTIYFHRCHAVLSFWWAMNVSFILIFLNF